VQLNVGQATCNPFSKKKENNNFKNLNKNSKCGQRFALPV
jgi:hypothetical protein